MTEQVGEGQLGVQLRQHGHGRADAHQQRQAARSQGAAQFSQAGQCKIDVAAIALGTLQPFGLNNKQGQRVGMRQRSGQRRMVVNPQVAFEPDQCALRCQPGNLLLPGVAGAVAQKNRPAQSRMFGPATRHALAPHPKRRWLHVLSHQIDHRRLSQTKLGLNRFEGGAVLPGHFHNARDARFA